MKTPADDDVRRQLERMVASATFTPAARLRAFLRYVVERTLAGDAAALKEYAIGVDVFQRDDQYDPRIDSIVRVEAGRLRAKLEEYYATEGGGDPIVISIARGSYVPVFTAREQPAPVVIDALPHPDNRARLIAAVALIAACTLAVIAVWRPSPVAAPSRPSTDMHVAVMPFAHFAAGDADERLAARITDGVTTELARINVVAVVSATTARRFQNTGRSLPDMLGSLSASTAVEGSVYSEGDRIRVRTRIIGRTDRKGDVRDFEGTRGNVDELARRIAEALSATFQARALQ